MSFFCLFFNSSINEVDIYPEEPDDGFTTYREAEDWLDSNNDSLEGWVLSHYPTEDDIEKFKDFHEDTESSDSDSDYEPSSDSEEESDYDSDEYDSEEEGDDDGDESDLSSGYDSE